MSGDDQLGHLGFHKVVQFETSLLFARSLPVEKAVGGELQLVSVLGLFHVGGGRRRLEVHDLAVAPHKINDPAQARQTVFREVPLHADLHSHGFFFHGDGSFAQIHFHEPPGFAPFHRFLPILKLDRLVSQGALPVVVEVFEQAFAGRRLAHPAPLAPFLKHGVNGFTHVECRARRL